MKRLRAWITGAMAVVMVVVGAGAVNGERKNAVYCPDGFVSVLAFGAKGDGVTDDTQAFQWAAQSGNGIFVPAGEFLVSDSIEIDSRVMIGVGEGESIITFTGTDPRKPIILAGSYSSIRDLTIRFADGLVTGNEQLGDRTAILTGAKWGLQRGASLRRVTLENVGTGVYAAEGTDKIVEDASVNEAGAFSVTFEDVTVKDFSYRGFCFTGSTRTGNVFRNLYFTSRFEADSALYFIGEESESVMDGLIVENVRAARPVYMFGMRAAKTGNIAFYNAEVTNKENALLALENFNGPIDSVIMRNCKAGEMLIRVGRGDYEYGTGVGSSASWIEIDTLLLDTVTADSIQNGEFSFIGRNDNDKGKYYVEIGRYLYTSKNGDTETYKQLKGKGNSLTVTVKEATAL